MKNKTQKQTVSQNEYLQMIGLKTLANGFLAKLDDIQTALEEITEEEEWGHTADTVWTKEATIDELLNSLNIVAAKK